jgi:hypothetical protein
MDDASDMSGTRRTPIARHVVQSSITPRAIAIFTELERAQRARKRTVDCTISEQGLCTTDCRTCRRRFDLHAELHSELRLKPWAWPCVGRNPFPPNSPEAQACRPGSEQQALWDLLDAARGAQPTKEHPYVEA